MKAQFNTAVAISSRRTYRADEVADLSPEEHARMTRLGLVRRPGTPNPASKKPAVLVEPTPTAPTPTPVVEEVPAVAEEAPVAERPAELEPSAPLSMEAFAALPWNEARAYVKALNLEYSTREELNAAYAAHLEG